MPTLATYHPPVSEFINKDLIPGDIAFIENAVDDFLSNVRYRNFLVNASAYNDVKAYAMDLVVWELSQEIPGTGIELVLFEGEAGSSFIPIRLETRWKILRYVHQFNPDSFSASAKAFFDLLLEMADTTPAEFLQAVADIFIADPNPVAALVEDIRDLVDAYDQGNASLYDPANEIKTHASAIMAALDQLVLDLQDPIQAAFPFSTAVEHIEDSIEALSDTLNAEIDLFQLAYASISQSLTGFDEKITQLQLLFRNLLGEFSWSDVEELIVPQFEVSVTNINAAIRFPRSWLRPTWYNPATEAYEEYSLAQWQTDKGAPTAVEEDMKSALAFQIGSATYSTVSGFDFDAAVSVDLEKSLIADTGLTITLRNVKPDFSRTENVPEASAAGYPTDFVGAYVEFASVELTAKWFKKQQDDQAGDVTLGIVGREMLLGTGGPTGTFSLEAVKAVYDPDLPNSTRYEEPALSDPPPADAELLFVMGPANASGDPRKGFSVGLKSFEVVMQQGSFVDTKIEANLYIPKLADPTKPIALEMSLDNDGDFDLTATFTNKAWPSDPENDPSNGIIGIESVFLYKMESVSVGKDDDIVYLKTAGELLFTHPAIQKIIEDPIVLENLQINSDGSFEVRGALPLPKNVSLKIGPAKISVTAIHFSSLERNGLLYKKIGFDGGLSMNPGGGDYRGDGVGICYRKDSSGNLDWFIHIEGIGIDLCIPGSASKEKAALLIQGYLSLKNPEYEGKISFQMPKAKLAGGAHMKYNTKTPAFIIDAHLELPTAIPLASTGLGIYGFRGLFGLRYIASKAEDETWFDYYKEDPKGVSISKMTTPDQLETQGHPPVVMGTPFSVGAGVTLATLPDDGFTFSMQLMLLVSVPTLIMLDGRANVLSKRVGITDEEPPLRAYVAFAPQDMSIEMGMGADFLIPKEAGNGAQPGDVLDLSVSMEAGYFFKDSAAWYLNFGTKSKPVNAKIFRLFNAYSYLMLSAQGIEAGAGLHFAFERKFPAVHVSAKAYFDIWGYLSFERPQIGGGVAIGGSIDVRVAGISLYIGLTTLLTAEASKPYKIEGYAELCVSVNLLFFKLEKCFTLQFKWERSRLVDTSPVFALGDAASGKPAVGIHMQSGDTYDLAFSSGGLLNGPDINELPPIPTDSWIELQFAKPLKPANPDFPGVAEKIGGFGNAPQGDREIIPPRNSSRKVYHSYDLTAVDIEIWDGANWANYNPYEALDPDIALLSGNAPGLNDNKIGYWQKAAKEYNKIRFLAQNPFEYMKPVGGFVPEEAGLSGEEIFCFNSDKIETRNCLNWEDGFGTQSSQTHFKSGAYYRIDGQDASVRHVANVHGLDQSLILESGSSLQIDFKEPAADIEVKLSSCTQTVDVIFQRKRYDIKDGINGGLNVATTADYIDIDHRILTKAQMESPVKYIDPDAPLDRVMIIPAQLNTREYEALELQLDRLNDELLLARIHNEKDRVELLTRNILQVRGKMDKLQSAVCKKNDNGRAKRLKSLITQKVNALRQARDALSALKEEYDKGCPVDIKRHREIIRDLKARYKEPLINTIESAKLIEALQKAKVSRTKFDKRFEKIEKRRDQIDRETDALSHDLKIAFLNQQKKCQSLAAQMKAQREQITTLSGEIEKLTGLLGELENNAQDETCCSAQIHEVCWFTKSQVEINANIPSRDAINGDLAEMVEAVNEVIAPIWKPDSTFRIKLDVRDNVSLQSGSPTAHPKQFCVGFRTGKPIGFFNTIEPIAPAASVGDPALESVPQSPKSRLSFYIDDHRSYPDPTGNILYCKPLYYEDAKIELAFNQKYVAHFFGKWPAYANTPAQNYALDIKIIDPARTETTSSDSWLQPLTDPLETHVAKLTPLLDTQLPMTSDIKVLQNILSVPDACRPPLPELPSPKGVKYKAETRKLSPLKTYTAVIRNHDLQAPIGMEFGEVHRYPFLTSRYRNFAEHIESYKRYYPDKDNAKETGQAVFSLSLDLGSSPSAVANKIADAIAMMLDPMMGDSQSYPHFYDRLYHAHLEIPDLGSAQSTEFTVLRNLKDDGTFGDIFGLLIRSDEPFNDPRLTDGELNGTAELKSAGVLVSTAISIMSKDRTEIIFMTQNAADFPQSEISVAFTLLGWTDGSLLPVTLAETEILEE